MAKNYYTRKLSYKLIPVYFAALLIAIYARPQKGSAQYIIGFILIAFGVLVRTWAAGHLSKNQRLVTSGPYRYVKNPLYVGTFCVVVGICMLAQGPVNTNSLISMIPMIMLALFLLFFYAYYVPYKMRKEYGRLAKLFPGEWENYSRSVPDYLPNFRPFNADLGRWNIGSYLNNSEHWTCLSILLVVVLIHFNSGLLSIFK